MLKLSEVLKLTGLKRSTLYYKMRVGEFPRPYKRRGWFAYWDRAEVEEYIRETP